MARNLKEHNSEPKLVLYSEHLKEIARDDLKGFYLVPQWDFWWVHSMEAAIKVVR